MKQSGNKTTGQMSTLIRKADSIEDFMHENNSSFVDMRFSDFLYKLLEDRRLIPADLVAMTSIDRSYIYHIMSGKRIPSKETILEIAFALHLNLDDSQLLLRLAGRPLLYSRSRQDAAIIFCIHKKRNLNQTNELLRSLGLPLIGKTHGT